MKRLSELPGLDVYADNAKYLGKIYDIVLDLQNGEVARVTLQPIESLAGTSPQWIKENTILYRSVTSVGDIVVVSSRAPQEPEQPEAPQMPQRPKYSFMADKRVR